MPDNNKKNIALGDWSDVEATGTASKLGYQGSIAATFGDKDFGESRYDVDNLPSDYIKANRYEPLRAERQGWGAEVANMIGGGLAKIPFTVIGNVASMLDFEDYYNVDNEVGNAITAWAEEKKGDIEKATKIYRSNDNHLSSREWWLTNGKDLIDSAGGFVLTGAGLGKGVQLLSNLTKGSKVIQGVGTVTNAAMLNQAESIPTAMNIYKDTYELGLQQGLDEEQAKTKAADAAAYSVAINRINIPLNLTSAAAFLRPVQATRQLVKDYTRKQMLSNIGKEGAQEYLEENINNIAENEARRKAIEGNDYTYNFDRTINDLLSKEGFEAGLIGFIGGAVQTGGTELAKSFQKDSPSYDEQGNIRFDESGNPVMVTPQQSQKERFKAQQSSLANIELLSKNEGVNTVKDTLNKIKSTATLLNDIQEAAANNDEYKVSELKNQLLTNQALESFKNGTTEQLVETYKSIARDPNSRETFGDDIVTKSQEAVRQIEDLEKVYNKFQGLPQVNDITNNRAEHYNQVKAYDNLKKGLLDAQMDQAKEIEITGFITPKQIESLASTKEIVNLEKKIEGVKAKVLQLNIEAENILSPEYTAQTIKTKEEEPVKKEQEVNEVFGVTPDIEVVHDVTPVETPDVVTNEPYDISGDISREVLDVTTDEQGNVIPVETTEKTPDVGLTPELTSEPITKQFNPNEIFPGLNSTAQRTKYNLPQGKFIRDTVNKWMELGVDINTKISLRKHQSVGKNAAIIALQTPEGNWVDIGSITVFGDNKEEINEGLNKNVRDLIQAYGSTATPAELSIQFSLTKPTLDIQIEGELQPKLSELENYNPETWAIVDTLDNSYVGGFDTTMLPYGEHNIDELQNEKSKNGIDVRYMVIIPQAGKYYYVALRRTELSPEDKINFFTTINNTIKAVKEGKIDDVSKVNKIIGNTFVALKPSDVKGLKDIKDPSLKLVIEVNTKGGLNLQLLNHSTPIDLNGKSKLSFDVDATLDVDSMTELINTKFREVGITLNMIPSAFKYNIDKPQYFNAATTKEVFRTSGYQLVFSANDITTKESIPNMVIDEKDIINAPEETIEQPITPKSKKSLKGGFDDVFSIGDSESVGISPKEIAEIEKILPSFIGIKDINVILNRLKVNGVTYGAFRNNIIYLNQTKGKPGTAYHEAFHAVFRTVLTNNEIDKYFKAAKAEYKGNLKADISRLKTLYPTYNSLSQSQLEELVYEEYMADRFADYSIDKSTKSTGSILKQLFAKIKALYNAIFNSDTLDVLYNKVYNGAFANSQFKGNRLYTTDTVFKLLPKGETETGFRYFTANRSRVIINTFSAKLHKAIIDGDTRNREVILDELIKSRYDELDTIGRDYVDEINITDKDKAIKTSEAIEDELYLLDPNSVDGEVVDLLKTEVLHRLDIFKYEDKIEDNIINEEDDQPETQEIKEQLGSKDAWLTGGHDSLSKTIKSYIAFTTYTKIDPLTGKVGEFGIDEVTLYNGLTRILADTNESNMFDKLALVSESNDNIKAFLDRITSEMGMVRESNTFTEPTDINAYNTFRLFVSNFKKSKATQIMTTVSPDGTYKTFNANLNEPKKISLGQWENSLYIIKEQNSDNKQLASYVKKAANTLNEGLRRVVSNQVIEAQAETIKTNLTKVGIELSIPYIKYSIFKTKQNTLEEGEDISLVLADNQLAFINLYNTVPLTYEVLVGNKGFNLSSLIAEGKDAADIYRKTEEGVDIASRMEEIADGNSYFDETIGNSSFTNAEGNRVYEIINKSYVLDQAENLNKESYLNGLLSGVAPENSTQAKQKNYEFIKDNYLLKDQKESLLKAKIEIINGFRAEGKDEGVSYGSYDLRTYFGTAMSYFANPTKSGMVRYIFRQNEASSTGYSVTLPKITTLANGRITSAIKDIMFNKLKQEYDRISREYSLGLGTGNIKGYNDSKNGRAYQFTEFTYVAFINPTLYNDLVKNAQEGNTDFLKNKSTINSLENAFESYLLNDGFKRFKNKLEDIGFISGTKHFIPNQLIKTYGDIDTALKEFYINDYIMSSSYNELLDGDYALSRATKGFKEFDVNGIEVNVPKVAYGTDITKRHKGGMASGPDYGKGYHKVSYIKDIDKYIVTEAIDGKFIRITSIEGDNYIGDNGNTYTKDQVSKITTNDAQSYSSQYHHIFGNIRLGRFDKRTANIYKGLIQFTRRNEEGKIVRFTSIKEKDQEYLESSLASANSKKTITFDGLSGIYHKMSEAGLWRSSISYIEDTDVDLFIEYTNAIFDLLSKDQTDSKHFKDLVSELADLYKPIPGMEYLHNLANKMDKGSIDHVITESASKGATISPVDSFEGDLLVSSQDVPNNSKRLQTETPTGKELITAGSQLINLIDTELDDNYEVTGYGTLGSIRNNYRKLMSETRNNSFKQAMTLIKEIDNNVDISKLRDKLIVGLEMNNTDENLLELFEAGYNLNIPTILDKAEQIVLAHFSKGVLNQKVNGTKVSLMSDAGIQVVRDENNNVVGIEKVLKNPSKYIDYNKSALQYNIKGSDGSRFSECMLSERILTKHGVKIGSTIDHINYPELFKSIGYRIPTQGHQSAMNLKIVGLLPNYYEGVGIFPQEIVYLSGADFDIDSEFIQLPQFWVKDGKPVVYGTEESLNDEYEGYKYYNKTYNKDFKRIYKRYKANGANEEDAYIATLNYFNEYQKELILPTSLEEYKESFNNGILNNQALELMTVMLGNDYVQSNSANFGTTTDPMAVVADQVQELKPTAKAGMLVPEDYISHNDINGKSIANDKNSAGKAGIGIVANKVQQLTLLLKGNKGQGIEFKPAAKTWSLDDQKGTGYFTKINNNRVMDTMGVMLNVMTDNAKDPIAGNMNLSLELLNGFTELVAQGMSAYDTAVLINQPIIQQYSAYKKLLNNQLKHSDEENLTNSKLVKATIAKYILNKTTNEAIIGVDEGQYPNDLTINISDLEDILKGISTRTLADKETNGKLDFEKLDTHDLIQIKALLQFTNAESQANDLSNVNTYLKLNQGLPISFSELKHDLAKAEDKLGSDLHIDIKPVLEGDALTQGNTKRAKDVLQVIKKVFIEQSDIFTEELNKLIPSLSQSFVNKKDSNKELSRQFLSYISTVGLKRYFKELTNNSNKAIAESATEKLNSMTVGLLIPQMGETLAQRLVKLQNDVDPDIRNNPLIKYLKPILDNKDGIHTIDGKSFAKESSETLNLLADGGRALLNHNDATRKFYMDLFSYLVVKDNLMFKYGSVAKYLIPGMYASYSKTLDAIINDFNHNNTNTFGNTFENLSYQFRKLYVTYNENSFGKVLFKTLDKSSTGFKQLSDGTLELRTYENGEISDISSAFEQDETKKFIFPQFHTFKIGNTSKVFELTNVDSNNHTENEAGGVGYTAIYKPLQYHGIKSISPYSYTTYDNATKVDDILKDKPKKVKPIEQAEVNFSVEEDLVNSDELSNFVNVTISPTDLFGETFDPDDLGLTDEDFNSDNFKC